MTQKMIEYKKDAQSRARILLVSDSYEEERILRSAFANVTVIKSVAVANKYFKEHPEELHFFDVFEIGSSPFSQGSYTFHYSSFCEYLRKRLMNNYAYARDITNARGDFHHILDFDFGGARTYIPDDASPEERKIYFMEGVNVLYEALAYARLFQEDDCFWLNHGQVDLSKIGLDYKKSRPLPKSEDQTRVLLLGPKGEYFASFKDETDKYDKKPSNGMIRYISDSRGCFNDEAIDVLGEYDIIISTSTNIQHLTNEVYMQNLTEGRKTSLLVNFDRDSNELRFSTVGNIGSSMETCDAPPTAGENVSDLIQAARALYKVNIIDNRETYNPPKNTGKRKIASDKRKK